MRVDADDPRAREERRVTRVLELAEELLGLQRELEAAMRSGLFDIAAARYSRPSCPVSRTQYDLNMRAQTRVATREEPAPAPASHVRARAAHGEQIEAGATGRVPIPL